MRTVKLTGTDHLVSGGEGLLELSARSKGHMLLSSVSCKLPPGDSAPAYGVPGSPLSLPQLPARQHSSHVPRRTKYALKPWKLLVVSQPRAFLAAVAKNVPARVGLTTASRNPMAVFLKQLTIPYASEAHDNSPHDPHSELRARRSAVFREC